MLDDECAFRWACQNGHLEVAKFLLSLENGHGKIDIHAETNMLFNGLVNMDTWKLPNSCSLWRMDMEKSIFTLKDDSCFSLGL